MSEFILKSFGNSPWEADPELTQKIRSIFNFCMSPPVQNKNVFGKDLKFDENANLIQLTMSKHILMSFSNENWDSDP